MGTPPNSSRLSDGDAAVQEPSVTDTALRVRNRSRKLTGAEDETLCKRMLKLQKKRSSLLILEETPAQGLAFCSLKDGVATPVPGYGWQQTASPYPHILISPYPRISISPYPGSPSKMLCHQHPLSPSAVAGWGQGQGEQGSGVTQQGAGLLVYKGQRPKAKKKIRMLSSCPVFFYCLLLPAPGARCQLLIPVRVLQKIPLLQVRVREDGR